MKLICIGYNWIGDKAPAPNFAQYVTATAVHRIEDSVYYELKGFPGYGYETKAFVAVRGPDERKILKRRKRARQYSFDFLNL